MGGLRRLEYRGYDSSGVAISNGTETVGTVCKAGGLANLQDEIARTESALLVGVTGIGHTRWATHGVPTDRNAHPHQDLTGKLAVVHNGIVENFFALRGELEADGVNMRSDTDSEIVAHLLERDFAAGPTAGDLAASMAAVCRRLDGAFTVVAIHADRSFDTRRRTTKLTAGHRDGGW